MGGVRGVGDKVLGRWIGLFGPFREKEVDQSIIFLFFIYTTQYIVYILDFVSKIMGIQLNTLEFNWARPC